MKFRNTLREKLIAYFRYHWFYNHDLVVSTGIILTGVLGSISIWMLR